MKRRHILAAGALLLLALGAWAQNKKTEDVEGKIRAAAFGYYSSMAMGDYESLSKSVRHPFIVLKDGVLTRRDEKASRVLLTEIADKVKQSRITNEDKGRILGNMIALFDDASVQFVGANTAHLTFVLKYGARDVGDSLNTLLVHKYPQGAWRVIGEITDSAPVPPSYLLDIP
jgi:hypothetical protein